MKLSKHEVYILGKDAVDRVRELYYKESGPDKSGAALMDTLIAELSRVRSLYEEIESKDSNLDDEDEFI